MAESWIFRWIAEDQKCPYLLLNDLLPSYLLIFLFISYLVQQFMFILYVSLKFTYLLESLPPPCTPRFYCLFHIIGKILNAYMKIGPLTPSDWLIQQFPLFIRVRSYLYSLTVKLSKIHEKAEKFSGML